MHIALAPSLHSELPAVASPYQVDNFQPKVSGLPFEEFDHVLEWLDGWSETPGPMGNTAEAALKSLAALVEMLNFSLDTHAG